MLHPFLQFLDLLTHRPKLIVLSIEMLEKKNDLCPVKHLLFFACNSKTHKVLHPFLAVSQFTDAWHQPKIDCMVNRNVWKKNYLYLEQDLLLLPAIAKHTKCYTLRRSFLDLLTLDTNQTIQNKINYFVNCTEKNDLLENIAAHLPSDKINYF